MPLNVRSKMRRFLIYRDEDESGVSGTGLVAEGVELTDGTVVMVWLTATSSMTIHKSVKNLDTIHGHGGKTRIEFIDNPGFDEERPKKKARA
jgi:hypothetical protein